MKTPDGIWRWLYPLEKKHQTYEFQATLVVFLCFFGWGVYTKHHQHHHHHHHHQQQQQQPQQQQPPPPPQQQQQQPPPPQQQQQQLQQLFQIILPSNSDILPRKMDVISSHSKDLKSWHKESQ